MTQIFAATADAVLASNDTILSVIRGRPQTMSATGLAPLEQITIEYRGDTSADFQQLNDGAGGVLAITGAGQQVVLEGVGDYRFAKSATAAPVGLYTRS